MIFSHGGVPIDSFHIDPFWNFKRNGRTFRSFCVQWMSSERDILGCFGTNDLHFFYFS